MYGFSQDEQLLLFMDCFGLTRLSRPKQAKTDAKVSGSESSGLVSVSADGTLGASYEDLWDKSVLWLLPEFKSSKRFDRFREREAVAHPDGAHYLTNEYGSLKIKPVSKTVLLPMRIDPPRPPKKASATEVTVDLSGGETLPPIEWGKDHPGTGTLRVSHDGTLLHFDGKVLVCVSLDGAKAGVRWRRPIKAPEYARVEFAGDAKRTVVMLHQGKRWLVHERVAGEGKAKAKEQKFEIESLAVPTVAGRFLAWQPSADTVRRRDLDSGDEQDFSVSVYEKGRKIDLKNEGMGTIFAGAGGSLMYLPPHRETIVDLVKGSEVSRKLPAKELELRQAVLDVARPYCEAARLAGVTIELGRLELNPKHKSVSVTHRIAGGDSLFGALLAKYSHSAWSERQFPGGWRMSGYGSHGGISSKDKLTTADIVEGYGALTEQGVGFAPTIGFWSDLLDRDGGPKDTQTLALLAQMLITTVRDGAKTKLDLAALGKRGAPKLAEVIDAFTHYPKRTQELPYETTRLAGPLFNRLFGAKAAELWCMLYLESKDWEHYGTHYSDINYHAIGPLLDAHPEAGKVFRAWLDDKKNKKVNEHKKWYVDQLRERLKS